jgi:hypothetical protein
MSSVTCVDGAGMDRAWQAVSLNEHQQAWSTDQHPLHSENSSLNDREKMVKYPINACWCLLVFVGENIHILQLCDD